MFLSRGENQDQIVGLEDETDAIAAEAGKRAARQGQIAALEIRGSPCRGIGRAPMRLGGLQSSLTQKDRRRR